MTLRSQLFRGDAKLEAAAAVDLAHIVPGSIGDHVRKIQRALNQLDNARLEIDGVYGQRTADAVLAYKQKRNIVNRSYQTQADNIVGRMTVARMDGELPKTELGPLQITVQGDKPRSNLAPNPRRPFLRLAFAIDAGGPAAKGSNVQYVTKFSRWSPGTSGIIRCAQIAGSATAVCKNERDISLDPPPSVKSKIAFLSDMSAPSNQAAFPNPEDGGVVSLTNDPHIMRFETLRPGDATITVSRVDLVRMLIVEVRQDRKGPVPRPPLTKLMANSKFFSASRTEGGEFDPHGLCIGRPVNPKLGGRLINLGGETETPQFEDYQVDLDHSFGQIGGFRPWADDPDSAAFLPSKSASHITMRGTPLFDSFVKVIRRIAQPGCRFTFNGDARFVGNIKAQLPGRELEPPIDGGTGFGGSKFVFLAWEIQ